MLLLFLPDQSQWSLAGLLRIQEKRFLAPIQNMNFSEYFKDGFVIGYVVSAGFVTASLMSYYYLTWLNLKLKQRRNRAKVCPSRSHIQRKKAHVHDQVSKLSLEVLSYLTLSLSLSLIHIYIHLYIYIYINFCDLTL